MLATIQSLIDQQANIAIPVANLTPRANLYDLGLTSFDAIRLLVAIEREFKVEFARESLKRDTMASIDAIANAVTALLPAPAAIDIRKDMRKAA
jgi:acyl carrier protein